MGDIFYESRFPRDFLTSDLDKAKDEIEQLWRKRGIFPLVKIFQFYIGSL